MSTSNTKTTDMKDYVKKRDIGNLMCMLKPQIWHYMDYCDYHTVIQFYNEIKEQLKIKYGIEVPQETERDFNYEY